MLQHLVQELENFRAWRNGAEPTSEQACEAILYYASHDAYQLRVSNANGLVPRDQAGVGLRR